MIDDQRLQSKTTHKKIFIKRCQIYIHTYRVQSQFHTITIKNLVTHTFQPLNVCVCDSCLERSSVFPFSCTTHCPFSVKPTSDMLSSISWLGSCSFSSGVLGKGSLGCSAEMVKMRARAGLGGGVFSGFLKLSRLASVDTGNYNNKMFKYRIKRSRDPVI